MPKLQAGVANTTAYFNIDAVDYAVRNYEVIYNDVSISTAGVVDDSLLKVGVQQKYTSEVLIRPVNFSDWTDSTDSVYGSLSALLIAMNTLIGFEPVSGGGGDVTKVGTPVNNEIGVWTGDGTLEGDTGLTWDTVTNNLNIGGSITLSSRIDGAGGSAPSLSNSEYAIYGNTSSGVHLLGQGSVTDLILSNSTDTTIMSVATGTIVAVFAGAVTVTGDLGHSGTNLGFFGTTPTTQPTTVTATSAAIITALESLGIFAP